MKKKCLVMCIGITFCLLLAGCGKTNGNQGKDPLTGTEKTSSADESASQTSSQDEGIIGGNGGNGQNFEELLGQEGNSSDIIDYINNNIESASDADARRYIGGLLGYGDNIRDIDFTMLNESRQYMPEDMIAFMELMKLESDTPSMVASDEGNGKVIGLTLSEMLERALLYEQHLEKYPNEVTSESAQRLYEEVATNAITGGYDKAAGTEHYYKGDSADVVDSDALKYYQQFADANSESNLGKVVRDYIDVLKKASFKINDDMEAFYHSLYQRLQITGQHATTDSTEGITGTGTAGTGNSTRSGSSSGTAGMGSAMNGGTAGMNGGM